MTKKNMIQRMRRGKNTRRMMQFLGLFSCFVGAFIFPFFPFIFSFRNNETISYSIIYPTFGSRDWSGLSIGLDWKPYYI